MSHHALHIVILAAGKGTRMYSQRPKVLHEIGGKPMLECVINTAKTLNPDAIHVVIGHGKKQILAKFAQETDIHWVEQKEQRGTGDAVKAVLPDLPNEGRTLILYGDVPLIDTNTLQNLLNQPDDAIALLTDTLDNPTGYGRIIRDEMDHVVAIVEEKDATEQQKIIQEINTGILVLPNAHLHSWLNALTAHNAQGEYYLTDVIGIANQQSIPVYPVHVCHSYLASGVNNQTQLAQLERIFQYQQAQQLLQAGVNLLDPHRFDLRGRLICGQDVRIDVNCVFEGDNTLGNNVHIGANCVLKNVRIADHTTIAPFSHLENCTIGHHNQIGPFARLRPNTVLADHVHIGNFVEVKNSSLGSGTKANHLTYLGDATIGSATNIGAGSITCNYDGVHKHRTTIGNDVRIGSNTMLVAPVHIGDKVTTGAGSVITRNCEAGKLVIARAKQQVIDHWVRPEKD